MINGIYNVYLASPIGVEGSHERSMAEQACRILKNKGMDVYCPWTQKIPHAWDYPNAEWGLMVFSNDVNAIENADVVVVMSYGRQSTAGTNWEAGYSFGIGKKIIVVEMTDEVMSLMVANGRWATVKGLAGLEAYDFEKMPKTRTETEQK